MKFVVMIFFCFFSTVGSANTQAETNPTAGMELSPKDGVAKPQASSTGDFIEKNKGLKVKRVKKGDRVFEVIVDSKGKTIREVEIFKRKHSVREAGPSESKQTPSAKEASSPEGSKRQFIHTFESQKVQGKGRDGLLIQINRSQSWRKDTESNSEFQETDRPVSTSATVKVLDEEGRVERQFSVPSSSFQMSDSGEYSLYYDTDLELDLPKIYHLQKNGKEIFSFPANKKEWSMEFSPDEGYALFTSERKLFSIYDARQNKFVVDSAPTGIDPNIAYTGRVRINDDGFVGFYGGRGELLRVILPAMK